MKIVFQKKKKGKRRSLAAIYMSILFSCVFDLINIL